MTTIVCDRKVMAADTRVTGGGSICHESKIVRIGTSLYGLAGDADLGLILLEWLRSTRNRLVLYKHIPEGWRNDVVIMELNPAGIVLWNGWGVGRKILDQSYAIGSGGPIALGLLRKGHSLQDCLAGAIEQDECSGWGFQFEYLKKPRKR